MSKEVIVIIANAGQEYAPIRKQGGQVLPQPAVLEKTPVSAPATRVSISPLNGSREAAAGKANERYTDRIERINQNSASDENGRSGSASGLKSLPPLKLFNEDDVNAYEKQLMSKLDALGVDTSIPIKLSTDFEGKVVVVGDHPDKIAIERAFADDMDLRNGFVQTANHFLFKEIAALHEQWTQKIEAGVREATANLWLINAVQDSVSKSSGGLSLENGSFHDPFAAKTGSASLAVKAYQP